MILPKKISLQQCIAMIHPKIDLLASMNSYTTQLQRHCVRKGVPDCGSKRAAGQQSPNRSSINLIASSIKMSHIRGDHCGRDWEKFKMQKLMMCYALDITDTRHVALIGARGFEERKIFWFLGKPSQPAILAATEFENNSEIRPFGQTSLWPNKDSWQNGGSHRSRQQFCDHYQEGSDDQ